MEVKSKPKKVAVASEIYDFSFNECRFGHYADKEGFFKSYPVAASLYGFFEFKNEEISKEEYDMWKDCMENPDKYIVTAEKHSRGFKFYTIDFKK